MPSKPLWSTKEPKHSHWGGCREGLCKATRRKLRGEETKKKNEKLRLPKKGENENIGEGDALHEQEEGGAPHEQAEGGAPHEQAEGSVSAGGGSGIKDIEDF